MFTAMVLQLTGVILLGAGSVYAGYRFSTLKKYYWTVGYIISLAVLGLTRLPFYVVSLNVQPPFSWLVAGHTEFVLTGVCGAVMLCTLIWKTDKRSYRIGLSILLTLVLVWFSISPFLYPILYVNKHKELVTTIDENNICRQSTGYTCGPAAAVTALKRLLINADEGGLAIACRATPSAGTQPDCLAQGIEKLYKHRGVNAEEIVFSSVSDLKNIDCENCSVIAVIKHGFMVDHYITILKVTDRTVITGDPLRGIQTYTYEKFKNIWRRRGVVVKRD